MARISRLTVLSVIHFLVFTVAQTPTQTTNQPDYCGTTWTSVYSPTYTLYGDPPNPTPPLPCPGIYSPQDGFCCSESCIWCADYSICLLPGVGDNGTTINSTSTASVPPPSGTGADRCRCPDGTPVYALPLETCVSRNPFWNGCPGNMLKGLCCAGAGVILTRPPDTATTTQSDEHYIHTSNDPNTEWDDYSPVCTGNTALFTVTTDESGAESTSSLPPGISYSNPLCYTCPLYTRSSTASKAAAPRTAMPAVITAGPLHERVGNGLVFGAALVAAVL